ncbi:MAG: chemotaxis protein CheB [Candidatus Velthaea sp.]
MTAASLIAVGASAGGIEALRTLIPNLPSGLPGAVAVVVHRMPVEEDKRLTRVLRVHSSLPVSTVTDGMKIEAGHVYVCPAGVHLVAQPEYFRLDRGPSENGYRPSIDVLFRSTAEAFYARGAGVVLSGLLDDGTAGLASIKAHGGYALVQDPSDALYGDMPRSAIENVHVDAIGTPKALAQLIDDFARAQELGVPQAGGPRARSQPSLFACPSCHGVLWQLENGGAVRFRCSMGHTYSSNALFTRQEETLEAALSTALRALVERADLSSRLAARARGRGLNAAARRFDRQASAANDRADSVRGALKPLQSID